MPTASDTQAASGPGIARTIAPLLPYLRRFARMLTGTQTSGDAYVAMTLEALIADPSGFDRSVDPRIELFRQFLVLWRSIHAGPGGIEARPLALPGEHTLSSLTPDSRVAFLLTAVEGFETEDAARILGLAPAAFAALLDTAAREIAAEVATDVLIIEDEPIIAMDLEALVDGLGHRVAGIARTRTEAVAAARRSGPGLILADIQLADGSSGLDAVNDILTDFDVPVIFVTAYPERLLTGQRPEPAFLITKPFRPETLKAVISQALFFNTRAAA